MECLARSLGLDVRESDHLGPFLDLGGDELTEVVGRPDRHRAAEVRKLHFHFGIAETGADFIIKLSDDIRRRFFWRANAEPSGRFVARQELTYCRNVRQRIQARRSSYSEGPQLASFDVLDRRRH